MRSVETADFQVVYQIGNTCGQACVAMLLQHHGLPGRFADVLALAPEAATGANASDLCQAAAALGLPLCGYRCAFAALPSMSLPAIVHLDNYHFAILLGINSKVAWTADPLGGVRKLSRSALRKRYSGVVLAAGDAHPATRKARRGGVRLRRDRSRTSDAPPRTPTGTRVLGRDDMIERLGEATHYGDSALREASDFKP